MKLGDAIASVATPIARTLGLDCVDPTTNNLRPESPCAQRQKMLNNFSDSIYDRFWQKTTKEEKNSMAQYIINKQIAVEASSPEEAVVKMAAGEGKTVGFNVTERPVPATFQAPTSAGARPLPPQGLKTS